MGTRALTVVHSNDDKEICVLYRQYDGYPEIHGEDLKSFIGNRKIVNGFNEHDRINRNFNGMECLAASLVAWFKKGIGDFYLHCGGTRNIGEEYIYHIRNNDGTPLIETVDVYATREEELNEQRT